MSDLKRAAAICDELAEVFRDAVTSGRTYEMLDELIAAIERAQQEVAEIIAG